MPENTLSQLSIKGDYLSPDDLANSYTVDYELGGIRLNDVSEGLQYQTWTLALEGNAVRLWADNTEKVTLFTKAGITEISLAFDQNMNPFVALVANMSPQFWWYNPLVGAQVFTDLPTGSLNPRCSLDDKRAQQSGNSDIILAYIRNGTLYSRQERDRYSIEYALRNGVIGRLDRIGMNRVNRLQFRIVSA